MDAASRFKSLLSSSGRNNSSSESYSFSSHSNSNGRPNQTVVDHSAPPPSVRNYDYPPSYSPKPSSKPYRPPKPPKKSKPPKSASSSKKNHGQSKNIQVTSKKRLSKSKPPPVSNKSSPYITGANMIPVQGHMRMPSPAQPAPERHVTNHPPRSESRSFNDHPDTNAFVHPDRMRFLSNETSRAHSYSPRRHQELNSHSKEPDHHYPSGSSSFSSGPPNIHPDRLALVSFDAPPVPEEDRRISRQQHSVSSSYYRRSRSPSLTDKRISPREAGVLLEEKRAQLEKVRGQLSSVLADVAELEEKIALDKKSVKSIIQEIDELEVRLRSMHSQRTIIVHRCKENEGAVSRFFEKAKYLRTDIESMTKEVLELTRISESDIDDARNKPTHYSTEEKSSEFRKYESPALSSSNLENFDTENRSGYNRDTSISLSEPTESSREDERDCADDGGSNGSITDLDNPQYTHSSSVSYVGDDADRESVQSVRFLADTQNEDASTSSSLESESRNDAMTSNDQELPIKEKEPTVMRSSSQSLSNALTSEDESQAPKICPFFNTGGCLLESNCAFANQCLQCFSSAHSMKACPERPTVCIENVETYSEKHCSQLHICMSCTAEHPTQECKMRSRMFAYDDPRRDAYLYCISYNATGRCQEKGCDLWHSCLTCDEHHPSIYCKKLITGLCKLREKAFMDHKQPPVDTPSRKSVFDRLGSFLPNKRKQSSTDSAEDALQLKRSKFRDVDDHLYESSVNLSSHSLNTNDESTSDALDGSDFKTTFIVSNDSESEQSKNTEKSFTINRIAW